MVRMIDAKYSTFIGTPGDIRAALDLIRAGSMAIDLKFCNFVCLAEPINQADVVKALEITPRAQRVVRRKA